MKFIEPVFKRKYFIPPGKGDDWPDASWAYYSKNPIIRYVYFSRLKESLKMIDNHNKNQEILDAGTGCGVLIPSLAQYGKVYAVDVYPKFLNKAKELSKTYNIKPEILKADITNLPFPDNKFDTITCISTLEHIRDLDKAFNELRRVLKKKSVLIIGLPIEKFFVKSIFGLFGITEKKDRGHYSHYTTVEKKIRMYFKLGGGKKIPFNFLPHSLNLYKIFKCIKQ